MKFIELTSAFDPDVRVYVQPISIGWLSYGATTKSGGVPFTNIHSHEGTLLFGVKESPKEIFDILGGPTGEAVQVFVKAADEPDAVDVAIDEAYERGVNDTLTKVKTALEFVTQ